MRIGWVWRRTSRGWSRPRRLPIFNLVAWEPDWSDRERIDFTPPPSVLFVRAGVIIAVSFLLGGTSWILGLPWSLATGDAPAPAEQVQELDRRIAELESRERRLADAVGLARGPGDRGHRQTQLNRARMELDALRREQRTLEAGPRPRRWFERLPGLLYWAYFLVITELGFQFGVIPLLQFPGERIRVFRSNNQLVVMRSGSSGPASRVGPWTGQKD